MQVILNMSKIKTFFLIMILTLTGCSKSTNQLQLMVVDAQDIRAAVTAHQGQEAVLMNFWATWCQPCVEEFPMIARLGQEYKSQGLQTYFVSVDFFDTAKKVRSFLTEQGVTGISFVKEDGHDNEFIDQIHPGWSGAVPFTIVFSKTNHEIIDFWEGEADVGHFRSAIEKALQR